jgi:hypothetical protein
VVAPGQGRAGLQILESSALGLRAARLTFNSRQGKSVTLFPMVHIGIPEFYWQVHEDAARHDVVLVEGVRSPIATRITRSYRWIVGAKRLGLVLQPKFGDAETGTSRVILADLTHEEFMVAWRGVPRRLRWLLAVAAPIYGLYHRWFGTLEGLARGHSMDDLTGRDEALGWTPVTGALSDAILAARDARLVQRLSEVLDAPASEIGSVAIVFGGAHMRAVIAELTRRRDYIAGDTRWLTVF